MDTQNQHHTSPICPDCGTPVGDRHKPGCDVERCPKCFQQKLFCGCKSGHTVWSGEWPDTLQDAKTRLDEMLGMTSEWGDHSRQLILRSPTGFPVAVANLYRGPDECIQVEFGQPSGDQIDWVEARRGQ